MPQHGNKKGWCLNRPTAEILKNDVNRSDKCAVRCHIKQDITIYSTTSIIRTTVIRTPQLSELNGCPSIFGGKVAHA